ncbi:MAG: peptidase M48 Ste24p [Bacteroidota bacterium]|nr:peptidase M48 Ste24p [Bacteroidota bacterium]
MFNFNAEGNLPTFYSVMAILFAALLLLIVGLLKKKEKLKDANYWLVLSAIFAMAYDEAAQIHERLSSIVRVYLPEESYDFLYWAWVLPYALLTLIFVYAFTKFLIRLPRRTAIYFIFSGIIFITGAIGMELFNSYFFFNEGRNSLGLHLAFTIEETLEMLVIALFIFAILDYIKFFMGQELFIGINQFKNEEYKIHNRKHIYLNEKELFNKYKVK